MECVYIASHLINHLTANTFTNNRFNLINLMTYAEVFDGDPAGDHVKAFGAD
jgi:hypothetical protein